MNRPKVGPGKVRADCGHRTDMWVPHPDGTTTCTDCTPPVPLRSLPALLVDLLNPGGAA